MSRPYELLFVVRPDVGEAGVKEETERARRVLEQHGASAIQVHDWGLRDLAYRIETYRNGWYILLEYEAEPHAVAELERTMKLSEQVLRFMSVRQSESAGQLASGEPQMPDELEDESPAGEVLPEAEEGEF